MKRYLRVRFIYINILCAKVNENIIAKFSSSAIWNVGKARKTTVGALGVKDKIPHISPISSLSPGAHFVGHQHNNNNNSDNNRQFYVYFDGIAIRAGIGFCCGDAQQLIGIYTTSARI